MNNKDKKIVLNRIMCDSCKDIIISRHTHDYVTCKCGNVSTDGGTSYFHRSWKDGATYTDMTLYTDSDFEEIRKLLTWGSRGKDGKQTMKFLSLSEMENDHLNALLGLDYVGDMYKEMFRKELEYRKEHNIKDIVRVCKTTSKS